MCVSKVKIRERDKIRIQSPDHTWMAFKASPFFAFPNLMVCLNIHRVRFHTFRVSSSVKCSLNWLASYEPIQIQTESEEKYWVQIGITITKDSRELLPFPPDGALPVQRKILIRVKFVKRQKWILIFIFSRKNWVPRILASFFRFL